MQEVSPYCLSYLILSAIGHVSQKCPNLLVQLKIIFPVLSVVENITLRGKQNINKNSTPGQALIKIVVAVWQQYFVSSGRPWG